MVICYADYDASKLLILLILDTREIQMGFLHQRCRNIDVQIKKHQARLHTVASKYSDLGDEKFLNEVVYIVASTYVTEPLNCFSASLV